MRKSTGKGNLNPIDDPRNKAWNMGQVFARVQQHIDDENAADPAKEIVLSRNISALHGEHFFAVTKDVQTEEMVKMSGDFITRVFEGPYSRTKDLEHDMQIAAKALGKTATAVYFFYTTCPKCAKAYGENYIVGFAQI